MHKKSDRKKIFFGIIITCEGGTMSLSSFDINNPQVQMIMTLKLQKLKSEELPTLCYENLADYLDQNLWIDHQPSSLHEAANDILHVTTGDIVQFMEVKAVKDGAKAKLEDFSDMLGGNEQYDQQ
jgi:hypothetical protein